MIYFTADDHLGHKNIIRFCDRPFHNVHNMNKLLIQNWNEVVSHNDTVFVLGDFAMGQVRHTLPVAHHLNGKKILVAGNHDKCWSGRQKDAADHWRDVYLKSGFTAVIEKVDIYLDEWDLTLTLSHFPFRAIDDDYRAFAGHAPIDDGQWLLHGHVHTAWKVHEREINVGVDVWDYYPVSMDAVLDLISP